MLNKLFAITVLIILLLNTNVEGYVYIYEYSGLSGDITGIEWIDEINLLMTDNEYGAAIVNYITDNRTGQYKLVENNITSTSWNPNKNKITVSIDNGTILIFDRYLHPIDERIYHDRSNITIIDWNYEGTFLAVGLENGTILVHELENTHSITVFNNISQQLIDITWSPIDNILAAIYENNTILFWDLDENKSIIYNHTSSIKSILWHPFGQKITFLTPNGEIYNIELSSPYNNSLHKIDNLNTFGKISIIEYSPTGDRLAIGDINAYFYVYFLQNQSLINIEDGHPNEIDYDRGFIHMAWNTDDKMAIVLNLGNTILWDMKSYEYMEEIGMVRIGGGSLRPFMDNYQYLALSIVLFSSPVTITIITVHFLRKKHLKSTIKNSELHSKEF